MLSKRCAALLVTAGLTAGGVAVAAPAQAADGRCVVTGMSPTSVVVGLSPVVKTFKVTATGCTLSDWVLYDKDFDFYAFADSPQDTFIQYSNADAGLKDVVVEAYNADYDETDRVLAGGFRLQRRTTWQSGSFNASPEPVRKGGTITVKGRLLRANWSKDVYEGYAGRHVSVQFKKPGGTWTTVTQVYTDSTGWARTTVKAGATGAWRLSYGGNTTSGPATSAGDSVQVTG